MLKPCSYLCTHLLNRLRLFNERRLPLPCLALAAVASSHHMLACLYLSCKRCLPLPNIMSAAAANPQAPASI